MVDRSRPGAAEASRVTRLEIQLDGRASGVLTLGDEGRLHYLRSAAGGVELTLERPARFLAALFPSRGRLVLMASPSGDRIRVGGLPVVELRVVDEGDVVEIGAISLRIRAEEEEDVVPDHPLVMQGKTCPVCLGAFAAGERATFCPVCRLAHHAEFGDHPNCLHYFGKCASNPFCGYVVPERTEPLDARTGG